MSEEPMRRRLAAILVADIFGYSRLTGIDEEGTVRRFDEMLTGIVKPAIDDNEGRFVKHTGDGFIASFDSVAAAFSCATRIQQAFQENNRDIPEDKAIRLRIGIDIGDIIIRNEDVFGNGVNIAARLEALARAGAICLSQRARDHLGQFDVEFVDLGEVELKNIDRPVRAFMVGVDAADLAEIVREEIRAQRSRWRDWRILAGLGAAVLALAVLGWWLWLRLVPPEPRAFFEQTLARVECSWLGIGEFSDGPDGAQFSVTGAAVAPGTSIRRRLTDEAQRAGVAVDMINVARIAPIEQPQCELFENLRRYRYDGISRLEIGEGGERDGERLFTLVYDPAELADHVNVYSIDPDGSIQLAQDRAALLDYSTRRPDGRYAADYRATHVGWGGFLLMESDAPIDNDIVMALADGEGEAAFAERARRDNWRFELAWLNVQAEGTDGES